MRSHREAGTPRKQMPTLLALAVGLAALAGCGGSSSSSTSSTSSSPTTSSAPASTASSTPAPATSSAGAEKLSLAANPTGQLKFTKTSLTGKAGTVSIVFTNTAPLAHNVTIESPSGGSLGAIPAFQGGSKTLTLSLKAGTYKFYCSVPGHRQAGMEGTLTLH